MQDATINSTNSDSYGDGVSGGVASGVTGSNAGKFEYVVDTSAAGGTVSIRGAGSGNGLLNQYLNAAATSSRGQRRFLVVRVPQHSSATLGSSLTAAAWNGSTGGVLVINVAGNLNLGGATVSVDGKGFRAGGTQQLNGGSGGANTDFRNVASNPFHGGKGEGIVGTPRYVYEAIPGVQTWLVAGTVATQSPVRWTSWSWVAAVVAARVIIRRERRAMAGPVVAW
jgi:hypothetical protein